MKAVNLRYVVDKTEWPDGPWMSEPDRIDFHHAGFACLMLRNARSGVWCGYVGVPSTHSAYGTDYSGVDVAIHGGLTYSQKCDGEHICHVPAPGETDDLFWLGFDCHHAWDRAPADIFKYPHYVDPEAEYRDVLYVRREVERLADQLSVMGGK